MSSAFNPADPAPYRPDAEAPSKPEARPPAPGMLEQVLNQTLSSSMSAVSLEQGDLAAMREVGRRLKGMPFVLDPVAIELIHAALKMQFQKLNLTPAQMQAMSREIATTLFEDDVSQARLNAMWLRLSQE